MVTDSTSTDEAELVLGEILSNTVEHAPGLVEINIDWSCQKPRIHVRDNGAGWSLVRAAWPENPLAENGRGLPLICALATDVTVEQIPAGGTMISCTLPVKRELRPRLLKSTTRAQVRGKVYDRLSYPPPKNYDGYLSSVGLPLVGASARYPSNSAGPGKRSLINQQQYPYGGQNSLLDLIVSSESVAILEHAVVKRLKSGDVLLDSNESIGYVYFPIDMMISVTTLMRDGSEIEVGTVGSEGMAGVHAVLDIDHVPGRMVCQVAGSTVRLPARSFSQRIDRSGAAAKIFQRYIQALINALEISVACNALHAVTARAARWLLITQDRIGRDEFGLTQEFLAGMLGVRRATLNAAAQELQDLGSISYSRGQVRILERAKLEEIACECYQLSIDRYSELLGQTPFRRRRGLPDGFPPSL